MQNVRIALRARFLVRATHRATMCDENPQDVNSPVTHPLVSLLVTHEIAKGRTPVGSAPSPPRKPLCGYPHRGFKSHPLRHF